MMHYLDNKKKAQILRYLDDMSKPCTYGLLISMSLSMMIIMTLNHFKFMLYN